MSVMRTGGPIMWVIAALSVVGLAVILERLLFFRRASTDPESLEKALGEALYSLDRDRASSVARSGESSLHRLFRAGVGHFGIETEAMRILMEQQVRREVYRWERGLSLLSTIARVAPLLGLLGTVVGLVDIFRELPSATDAPMASISGGLWKALFTTVAGLTVAIPAILCHSFLSSRIDNEEETLNRGADYIIWENIAFLRRTTPRNAADTDAPRKE
jgi:biopolymer transport protein ExbB